VGTLFFLGLVCGLFVFVVVCVVVGFCFLVGPPTPCSSWWCLLGFVFFLLVFFFVEGLFFFLLNPSPGHRS